MSAGAAPGTGLAVLIVDDEPLARLRLRALLDGLDAPPARVVAEAEDADAALALLRAGGIDLALLDIRMPGRDGLRLAAAIKSLALPPAVVFVTAHGEHALRAFDLDAADYLTKPVRRERLQAALARVAQRRAGTAAAAASTGAEAPMLVVTERGRLLRLPLAEVLYLKAEQKYVTLRTARQAHIVDEALTDLEQRLGDGFLRIHRNALVARHAVRELELHDGGDTEFGADGGGQGWAVRVAPVQEWLAVSRRQVAAVRQALAP
ncbi:MAG: response regulator transcription factor [Burkholderiales bacterium]|nr:response regulator transcription factor [Burkholderiales bacterium]